MDFNDYESARNPETDNRFIIFEVAIQYDYKDGTRRCNASSLCDWMYGKSYEECEKFAKKFTEDWDIKHNSEKSECIQKSFVVGSHILTDHIKA